MQTLTKATTFMPHVHHGFSFTTHATYKQTKQQTPLTPPHHHTTSSQSITFHLQLLSHQLAKHKMSRKLGTFSDVLGTRNIIRATNSHADSAFLCLTCDTTDNMVSQYKHMKMCDACSHVPAAFVCKADAASLCSSCDAEIHSANPLASRHERVSILPIGEQSRGFDDDDVAEVASWLVLNPEKNDDGGDELLFGGKVNGNEYLELVEDCNSCGETENRFYDIHFDDCSVPRGSYEMEHDEQVHSFQTGAEFESSKPSFGHGYSITSQSISTPTEVNNIVPGSTVSEVSISDSNSAIGLYSGASTLMPSSYLTYRESRVLRYREKKKTRKFEKKIRYASRKAYAEVRPRIKGRFAKRNNGVEAEMDHMFSSTLITEAGCNVVPSF